MKMVITLNITVIAYTLIFAAWLANRIHLQRLMDFLTILNQQGITILLITHDYKLVHRYARRVILIEEGRITLDGRLRREGEAS